ncbi:hypothetical protein V8E54_013875 [Elaphomyces granulatus]
MNSSPPLHGMDSVVAAATAAAYENDDLKQGLAELELPTYVETPFTSLPVVHLLLEVQMKILSTDPSALFISDDGAIPLQHAAVSFNVAKVIATTSTDDCRFFTTQITAFKQKDDDGPVYEPFWN